MCFYVVANTLYDYCKRVRNQLDHITHIISQVRSDSLNIILEHAYTI